MRPTFGIGTATFIAPAPSLAGSVRGYIVRDRPARGPQAAACVNRYPASGYCALVWYLQGASVWAGPGDRTGQPMPRHAVIGPQTRPFSTCHHGPVRTFGVVLSPHVLARTAGLDLTRLVDTVSPAEAVLPPPWLEMCRQVECAHDDEARVACLEAFLRRCGAVPSDGFTSASAPLSWIGLLCSSVQGLEGGGDSPRSLTRRVLRLAGQPMRRLARLARAEAVLTAARNAAAGRVPRWADAAVEGGYADQAHLCREARRVTGLSPGELALRVETDEGLWLYRVWQTTRSPSES